MERIKKIIKNLFFAVMLLAITISDGSFANIKKVKAAETQTHQYLVVINKPHVLQGGLEGLIDGLASSNSGIKKIDDSSYLQVDMLSTTDFAAQYKSIVGAIDSSTVYRNGYHIKSSVACGPGITSRAEEVPLDTAKSMIFGDSSSHRALFIRWECDHITDSSKWALTSAATCQHGNEYACLTCGATKSETYKIAHDYSIRYNAATCAELVVYKCTMCNSTITTGEYGAHNWAEKKVATCTSRRILYCKTCGNTKEDGDVTAHKYVSDKVVAPTAVSKGYTRHSCVCGAYYDDKFTYKIEYDANGGVGNIGSQIVNYDSNEVLKQNTFAKEGCYFTGWNTKEDGTGTSYKDGQAVKNISTSTVRLYAQWKKCKYIVTCVDCYEDGSVIDSINNNKTMEVESGEMVSGENFGKDDALGAYYPGLRYLYSDAAITVSGAVSVKRYFKNFKKYGLTEAVIAGDTLEKVSGKSEDIIIPDEIKVIGEGAFEGNTDVKTVEIKNGTLTKIGDKAFENCTGLKKIILPYSVKSIGKDAFKGCTYLEMIEIKNPECKIDESYDTIPEKTKIRGFSGSSAQTYSKKNHKAFENITIIYDDFFCDEIYLNKFSIPDDVETIGDNAFKECGNLKEINLGKIKSIGKSAFENCVSLEYGRDFSKKQTGVLIIPASVKKIGERAFFNDKKIAQMKFEGKDTNIEDKTAIDENTFIGCYAGSPVYDFAKENGYIYVDTGAMYRGLAIHFLNLGIDPKDTEKIIEACKDVEVTIGYESGIQQIYVNGENVTAKLRTEEVGNMASMTSAIPEVRGKLLELQRTLAREKDVIMDGRDIGTHVLPDADVKIYLTASVEIRAKRRYKELVEKGVQCDLKEIEKDIEERDYRDMTRKIAPLKKAEDAILVDSSDMTLKEVVNTISRYCHR